MELKELIELLDKLQHELNSIQIEDVVVQDSEDKVAVSKDFETLLFKVKSIYKQSEQYDEIVKTKVLEFLKSRAKQALYEGDIIKMQYIVRRTLEGSEDADPEFVTPETVYKVNTKSVRAYEKGTGELPRGVKEKATTYPKYDLLGKETENEA